MKKSSKKFVISSQVKNDKGFRVLTSGIDITAYQANPIMLLMHQRPTGTNRNEAGVLGGFVDLHFADEKLYGTPSFDDKDDYALKYYDKVENDVMRMCSAGLLPLKWGKDEAGDLWLLESKLVEVSLADIGSNSETMAVSLCNESGELITLSLDQIQENLKTENKMKIVKLSAGAVALGLSATLETETAVEEAVQKLVQLTADSKAEIVTLTAAIATAETAAQTAKDELVQLKADTKKAENKAFVALAVQEGKIVVGDAPKYEKLMAEAPETGKEIIDALPKNKSVMELLKAKEDAENPLVKLSYDELDTTGKLETLKAELPEVFKAKFKEKFGTEYPS